LFAKEWDFFKENKEKAAELLTVGEFKRDEHLDVVATASYTIIASTLMNFDEFVVIR
jgi:hypothetical protein